MSDLEKLIRDTIKNGSTSEDVAMELADVLNSIEKEQEEAKAKEEEKKKAQEKFEQDKAKKEYISKLAGEFDNKRIKKDELTPRDVAIVALIAAYQRPANKNWSLEKMEEFLESMTKGIDMTFKMQEGNLSLEETLDKALKLMGNSIKSGFKRKESNLDSALSSKISPFDEWFSW